MEVVTSIPAMRLRARQLESQGMRIGLVPTMGFLHDGHLSLARLLRPRCDHLWLSIFVNPAQFGPSEDLARYPRDLERDLALCRAAGVDGVMVPDAAEVYPADFATWVVPGPAAERYCGALRPGHFRGVLSIVLRLFMWTRCRCAAFGAKDAQQLWLIRRMVRDLDLDVELVEGPTLREADGLAMSSRNVYLDAQERGEALALHSALESGEARLAAGRPLAEALDAMEEMLRAHPQVLLEYLHIADWESLDSLAGLGGESSWRGGAPPGAQGGRELVLLLAARVGRTRLIDNLRVVRRA
jgi:pantoate--beta-alanine ligase